MSSVVVNIMAIAERFKEERTRLGLSQAALAEKIGATKRSVINWEGGAASPSADAVARFAATGADVLYILTGVINSQILSSDEQELIAAFRAAPLMVKAAAIGALTAGAVAPSKKTKKIEGSIQNFHSPVDQVAGRDVVNQGRRKK